MRRKDGVETRGGVGGGTRRSSLQGAKNTEVSHNCSLLCVRTVRLGDLREFSSVGFCGGFFFLFFSCGLFYFRLVRYGMALNGFVVTGWKVLPSSRPLHRRRSDRVCNVRAVSEDVL